MILNSIFKHADFLSVWTQKELSTIISNRDLRRLREYSKNMIDHHLITDLVPTLASLFFTERFDESVTLNAIQSAIMLGVGLQRKTVDEVAESLGMPINQVLALYMKAITRLSEHLDEIFINAMEEEVVKARENNDSTRNKQMHSVFSLEKDLEEAEKDVIKRQKKDREALIDELELDQYKIKGTEEDWQSAINDINLTSTKGKTISVKTERSVRKNFALINR